MNSEQSITQTTKLEMKGNTMTENNVAQMKKPRKKSANQQFSEFVEKQNEVTKFQNSTAVKISKLQLEADNFHSEFINEMTKSFIETRIKNLQKVGRSVFQKYGIYNYDKKFDISTGYSLSWIFSNFAIDSVSERFVYVYPRVRYNAEDFSDPKRRVAIPRRYLHMSDRDFAKKIRRSIKQVRLEEAQALRIFESREIDKMEAEIQKLQKALDKARKNVLNTSKA